MLLVNTRLVRYGTEDCLQKVPWLAPVPESQEEQVCIPSDNPEMEEGEVQRVLLPRGDGDRRAGFEGSCFSITKLSSLALVTPTQLPQDGREQNEEVIQKEPEMLPRGERPEECSGPL